MTVAELKRLDAGSWLDTSFHGERIPMLSEVFEAAGKRCGLNIELKSGATEGPVCAMIAKRAAYETTIVSSFDWSALARVHRIDPAIKLGVLADRDGSMIETARVLGAHAIHPRYDLVGESLCALVHRDGCKVLAWTVDDPDLMRRLAAAGVDGIMTNYPARLRAATG